MIEINERWPPPCTSKSQSKYRESIRVCRTMRPKSTGRPASTCTRARHGARLPYGRQRWHCAFADIESSIEQHTTHKTTSSKQFSDSLIQIRLDTVAVRVCLRLCTYARKCGTRRQECREKWTTAENRKWSRTEYSASRESVARAWEYVNVGRCQTKQRLLSASLQGIPFIFIFLVFFVQPFVRVSLRSVCIILFASFDSRTRFWKMRSMLSLFVLSTGCCRRCCCCRSLDYFDPIAFISFARHFSIAIRILLHFVFVVPYASAPHHDFCLINFQFGIYVSCLVPSLFHAASHRESRMIRRNLIENSEANLRWNWLLFLDLMTQ